MSEIQLRRRLIFSAPISTENWGYDMIRHIQIAKAMGATMFEIDVPGTIPVPKKSTDGMLMSMSYFFGGAQRVEGDEWKDAAEARRNQQKVETPVVSVWAMTVEDAEAA